MHPLRYACADIISSSIKESAEAQWYSIERSGVLNLPPPCCVHESPKLLVIPRKRWLRPDMTEKLLTGTLSLNTNKQLSSVKVAEWPSFRDRAVHTVDRTF